MGPGNLCPGTEYFPGAAVLESNGWLIDWLIDWFIDCPSRPKAAMQRTTINTEFPPFAFRNQAVPTRIASPYAPAGSLYTDSLSGCSVSVTCQAFPGPPLLLYDNNHSSSQWVFEYCGWDCPELAQESRPEEHLGCLYCHWRATENLLDVDAWMLACPHLLSFVRPVSALEQNVVNRLASMATRALHSRNWCVLLSAMIWVTLLGPALSKASKKDPGGLFQWSLQRNAIYPKGTTSLEAKLKIDGLFGFVTSQKHTFVSIKEHHLPGYLSKSVRQFI